MSSNDNLPVILVSAVDVAAASAIIMELISSDSREPPQTNGVGVHEQDDEEATERGGAERGEGNERGEGAGRGVVWRLENKYYTASVRLLPRADRPARAGRPASEPAHAHLIYLTENECSEESACCRRAEAARGGLARGAVRLVAACGDPAPALCAAARRLRYELVPLAPDEPVEPDEGDEEAEPRGVARLREALHAHVWPGLVRRRAPHAPPLTAGEEEGDSSASSDGESWGPWRGAGAAGEAGEEEEAGWERSEQFLAALAQLPGGGEPRGDRRRAERLVAAVCRALGHSLPLQPEPGDGGGGGGGGDQ